MEQRFTTATIDGATYLIHVSPTVANPGTEKEGLEYWVEGWKSQQFWALLGVEQGEPTHDTIVALLRRRIADTSGINPVRPVTGEQINFELDVWGGNLDAESLIV